MKHVERYKLQSHGFERPRLRRGDVIHVLPQGQKYLVINCQVIKQPAGYLETFTAIKVNPTLYYDLPDRYGAKQHQFYFSDSQVTGPGQSVPAENIRLVARAKVQTEEVTIYRIKNYQPR